MGLDRLLFNVYKEHILRRYRGRVVQLYQGLHLMLSLRKSGTVPQPLHVPGILRHNFIFVIEQKCSDEPEFFPSLSFPNLVIGFPSLCTERKHKCM